MNAVSKVAPELTAPPLTDTALTKLIRGLPRVETLDEDTFTDLGRRIASCLEVLKAKKDGYAARHAFENCFSLRFHKHMQPDRQQRALFNAWIDSWEAMPPLQDPFDAIVDPDAIWIGLLALAGPLIAAEGERKARQVADEKRQRAEREKREQEEETERFAANLRARQEAREASRPFHAVRASSLAGKPVPATRWLVPRWLPVGCTTVLYGMPGTGKTLLAQMLATSCATGMPWLGQEVVQCKAFALFGEDDESVIHGRQADISARMGVDFTALNDLEWACPVGDDNTLMRFPAGGEPETTDYFDHLREKVLDEGTRLLILDTASVVFGGDPNDRNEVTMFLGHLTSLARQMDGAVLLNTHPSQSAMSSGGGLGHSVAWLGSARAVWRLDGRAGQARTLTRTKSNLSSTGDQVKLWMRDGVLDTSAADTNAEGVFLTLLRQANERGDNVSAKETSKNFAPTVFAKDPGRSGFDRDALRVAMDRLMAAGTVRSESYGKPSQGFTRLAIASTDAED